MKIGSLLITTKFDRKNNIGLHHFALKVADLPALKSIHQTLLNTPEVEIEFAPEPLDGSSLDHMMFYSRTKLC